MSADRHYVAAAQLGDCLLFRVVGLGDMRVSPAIAGLTERVMSGGIHKFAFEMSGCVGMDSTFMGTLVGLSLVIKAEFPEGWVCIVNGSERLHQMLESLGAARFLRLKPSIPLEDIEMERLDVSRVPEEKRIEVIRKAHERLIDIDKRNAERFGPFLKNLNRELNR